MVAPAYRQRVPSAAALEFDQRVIAFRPARAPLTDAVAFEFVDHKVEMFALAFWIAHDTRPRSRSRCLTSGSFQKRGTLLLGPNLIGLGKLASRVRRATHMRFAWKCAITSAMGRYSNGSIARTGYPPDLRGSLPRSHLIRKHRGPQGRDGCLWPYPIKLATISMLE